MLDIIAKREDPDQTASSEKQSDLGLHCLSCSFWHETIVQSFRTSAISHYKKDTNF